MADNEKKPIYKKWWFWLIIVVVVLAIGGIGMQDNEQPTSTTETQTTTTETQPTTEDIVFLKGTNGKEFFEILCEVGEVEKKEGVDNGDTITYASSNDNFGIELETNKNNEINFISIYTLLDNKDDYQNFFNAISRLGYENFDKATYIDWILDNIGNEATTKIGDVNLKLYKTSSGTPALDVFTDGNEEYQKQLLEKVSN